MNKLIPILGVLGAGGTVGGGILLSSKLFSNTKKETIKDRLSKDKYQILSTTSSDHWTNILTSYQKLGNKWKLEGKDMADVDVLKRACDTQSNSEYSNELYKSFTKWCVVPRTAEDLLKEDFSLLESNDSHATDKESWKHNVDSYESYKTTNSKYALNDVTFNTGREDENVRALKTGCKTRKGKFTYDVDLDSSIEEIKTWCLAKK